MKDEAGESKEIIRIKQIAEISQNMKVKESGN